VAAVPGPKYTQTQKESFFDLIDKGDTVRAAANAVGVHEDACYTWLRQAGPSMQPACCRSPKFPRVARSSSPGVAVFSVAV
jgi:transposase-like protein